MPDTHLAKSLPFIKTLTSHIFEIKTLCHLVIAVRFFSLLVSI